MNTPPHPTVAVLRPIRRLENVELIPPFPNEHNLQVMHNFKNLWLSVLKYHPTLNRYGGIVQACANFRDPILCQYFLNNAMIFLLTFLRNNNFIRTVNNEQVILVIDQGNWNFNARNEEENRTYCSISLGEPKMYNMDAETIELPHVAVPERRGITHHISLGYLDERNIANVRQILHGQTTLAFYLTARRLHGNSSLALRNPPRDPRRDVIVDKVYRIVKRQAGRMHLALQSKKRKRKR